MFYFRKKNKKDPQIIFLENHGIFVSADSIDEVKSLYNLINKKISSKISKNPDLKKIEVNPIIVKVLPAIRMMLSSETIKVVKVRNNKLIENFLKDILVIIFLHYSLIILLRRFFIYNIITNRYYGQ